MADVLSINRTPKDFVARTRHLSVEDRGAYQEILDQIVILGQDEEPPSLPDDDKFISNLLGWPARKWRETKSRLCEGPHAVLIVESGRISQTRIVEEIEAARLRIAQASKAGNASAEARRKLRDRMHNGSTNASSTRVATAVGTRVVPEGQLNGNSWGNSTATSHESLVTSNEESKQESTFAGAREGTSPAPKQEPPKAEAVPVPDFDAVKRVDDKLAASALKVPPPQQVTAAWVGDYGEELIVETLADCEDQYKGKHFKYLESILTNRRDNPDQRPGQRRARRTRDDTRVSAPVQQRTDGERAPVTVDDVREIETDLRLEWVRDVDRETAEAWVRHVRARFADNLTAAPTLREFASKESHDDDAERDADVGGNGTGRARAADRTRRAAARDLRRTQV